MEDISKEFDKIFEANISNNKDHVYTTLSYLDNIGYLPFSFVIPPQYWQHPHIEGYTENDTKKDRQASLIAIKNFEELLTKSCIIDQNDDFTTSENRFDPTLIKQGYYYILTLPYKLRGPIIKDTPTGVDRTESEFIDTAKALYKKNLKG